MIFEGKSSSSSTSRPSERWRTPSTALRSMREKYRDDGFEILAIPVNRFGCQAPGTSAMERRAARRKFGVDDLEVFDKVGAKAKPVKCKGIDEVAYEAEFKDDPDAILSRRQHHDPTSSRASPVYEFLKRPPFDGELPWNYTKFLVDRNGHVVRRYAPGDPLEQGFESDLRKTLAGHVADLGGPAGKTLAKRLNL